MAETREQKIESEIRLLELELKQSELRRARSELQRRERPWWQNAGVIAAAAPVAIAAIGLGNVWVQSREANLREREIRVEEQAVQIFQLQEQLLKERRTRFEEDKAKFARQEEEFETAKADLEAAQSNLVAEHARAIEKIQTEHEADLREQSRLIRNAQIEPWVELATKLSGLDSDRFNNSIRAADVVSLGEQLDSEPDDLLFKEIDQLLHREELEPNGRLALLLAMYHGTSDRSYLDRAWNLLESSVQQGASGTLDLDILSDRELWDESTIGRRFTLLSAWIQESPSSSTISSVWRFFYFADDSRALAEMLSESATDGCFDVLQFARTAALDSNVLDGIREQAVRVVGLMSHRAGLALYAALFELEGQSLFTFDDAVRELDPDAFYEDRESTDVPSSLDEWQAWREDPANQRLIELFGEPNFDTWRTDEESREVLWVASE